MLTVLKVTTLVWPACLSKKTGNQNKEVFDHIYLYCGPKYHESLNTGKPRLCYDILCWSPWFAGNLSNANIPSGLPQSEIIYLMVSVWCTNKGLRNPVKGARQLFLPLTVILFDFFIHYMTRSYICCVSCPNYDKLDLVLVQTRFRQYYIDYWWEIHRPFNKFCLPFQITAPMAQLVERALRVREIAGAIISVVSLLGQQQVKGQGWFRLYKIKRVRISWRWVVWKEINRSCKSQMKKYINHC